jgi:hypothetical protein
MSSAAKNRAATERTCLLLVHGTFASEAMWESSPLVLAMKNAIPNVTEVKAIKWSGANTFRARFEASKTIINVLEGLGEDERAIVCAHSHGGSAVCYAMRDRPNLAKKIRSVVFLATPFYDARVLPSWRLMLDGLFAPLAFLAFYCIVALVVYLSLLGLFQFASPDEASLGFLVYLAYLVFIVAIIVFAEVGLRTLLCVNRIKAGYARRVVRHAARVARSISCEIPADTHAYFVRRSGDEASAFLSVLQGLSWIIIWVNAGFARGLWFVGRPFRAASLRRPVLVRVLLMVIGALCLWAAATAAVSFALNAAVGGLFGGTPKNTLEMFYSLLWSEWRDEIGAGGNAFNFLMAATTVALTILLAAPVLFFAISTLLLLSNWLLSLAFGALPISVASVLQPAVEATPPGKWSLDHATWRGWGRKGEHAMMRHSSPYSDPGMIEDIVRWLAERRADEVRATAATG